MVVVWNSCLNQSAVSGVLLFSGAVDIVGALSVGAANFFSGQSKQCADISCSLLSLGGCGSEGTAVIHKLLGSSLTSGSSCPYVKVSLGKMLEP